MRFTTLIVVSVLAANSPVRAHAAGPAGGMVSGLRKAAEWIKTQMDTLSERASQSMGRSVKQEAGRRPSSSTPRDIKQQQPPRDLSAIGGAPGQPLGIDAKRKADAGIGKKAKADNDRQVAIKIKEAAEPIRVIDRRAEKTASTDMKRAAEGEQVKRAKEAANMAAKSSAAERMRKVEAPQAKVRKEAAKKMASPAEQRAAR